jgi:hypothetical protein
VRPLSLALLALLWGAPVPAQPADYLETEGLLSLEDFYRLVSCRALPGGPCTAEPVRWPPERARDLRVGFASLPRGYPQPTADRMARAVDAAIREINDAGAALRLRRAKPGEDLDIAIHLAPVDEGDLIEGTGVRGVDGQEIGAALVTVWWDEKQSLTDAVIVLAEDLPEADLDPVVLEELTQAMGLMTDIRNPDYEGLSVFSEDSNRVTRLGPQDRDALRRHYPPETP